MVFEMSEIARNTPFQHRRISRTRQQPRVVIAFKHQSVATVENVDDMRSDFPAVCEHSQPVDTIGKHVLCGFPRIVGNRKRRYLKTRDTEWGMSVDHPVFRLKLVAVLNETKRPVRKIDGNPETAGKPVDAGDVVAVFVSDQNAGNLLRKDRQPGEPADHGAD